MPGYKGKEYYAPVQTPDVNKLEKRFLGLTDIQIGLFSLPTIVIIGSFLIESRDITHLFLFL